MNSEDSQDFMFSMYFCKLFLLEETGRNNLRNQLKSDILAGIVFET